jgi:hypothetical protein
VAKVGTSKAGGTISQQAAVHPWLAADARNNKQINKGEKCLTKAKTLVVSSAALAVIKGLTAT